MTEEQLQSALDGATAHVEPHPGSFAAVAAAGRRRRHRSRALSALAATVLVAGAAAGAVALVGGSGAEDSLRTVDEPRPTVTAPTPTTPEPTVVPPAPDPTTAAPPASTLTSTPPPETAAPTRPVFRPAAVGDVDGDGVADPVTIAAAGADQAVVHARLSALGDRELTTPVTDTYSLAVKGVSDIDADGFGEVFLQVGHGASTAFVGLLRLVDDQLVRVGADPGQGGGPATFAVNGSTASLGSLTCLEESDWLVWSEATPTDDARTTYTVHTTGATLEGDHLRIRNESSEVRPAAEVPSTVTACDGIPEEW